MNSRGSKLDFKVRSGKQILNEERASIKDSENGNVSKTDSLGDKTK